MEASHPPTLTCPKCGHVRAAEETAPGWQCPACGIAYHKYRAYLEGVRAVATPPRAGAPAPGIRADGSVWALVLANLVTLAVALAQSWDAASLMLIYWTQSVVIGLFSMLRILALDRFSTENFKINDRSVQATPAVRAQVALFFACHYGLFHLVYLMFLTGGESAASFDLWLGLCALVFVVNHFWSYRYNVALDRTGTPNIGTLMFMPYIRIVPMHLTIIFGGAITAAGWALALFVVLKTIADVSMHEVEHKVLQKVRESAAR